MLKTLSARLFLLTGAVALTGLLFLAWIVVRVHTKGLEQEAIEGSLRLSETLRRSTRSSMLKNRKEDVYEIINTVGAQQGMEEIRIYNKGGRITFSTDPDERGRTVDSDAEACTQCHGDGMPASRPENLTRVFRGPDGGRVLGLITPIYNEPACAGAACHTGPEQQQVLGVLDVRVSLDEIDTAIAEQNRRFLAIAYVLILVIASTCGLFLWRFVHVPVKQFIRGTEQIAAGNLNHRISIKSDTEIGRLADSFNQMTEQLEDANKELTGWARTLEQRVQEKAESLRQAQSRLVQNEKMASLGALSATVAHEINNPLSGVLTYTRLANKLIGVNGPDKDRIEDIHNYLQSAATEVVRCGRIVGNLLEFSRQSGVQAEPADLNDIVEKTLMLVAHKLDLQGMTLNRQLSDKKIEITCDNDQIRQALLAVFINAMEAMSEGGELTVCTDTSEEPGYKAEIQVTDTGVGIPAEVLPHLFEPFYTTKQDKKGVGLGLSVVYGIVKRHQGRIELESEPGRGATVKILLPEEPEIPESSDAEEPILAASTDRSPSDDSSPSPAPTKGPL